MQIIDIFHNCQEQQHQQQQQSDPKDIGSKFPGQKPSGINTKDMYNYRTIKC